MFKLTQLLPKEVACLLFVILLCSCQENVSTPAQDAERTRAPAELLQKLMWVKSADGLADARRDFDKNDISFWGIYLNRSLYMPGIEEQEQPGLSAYPVKTQEGVGDVMYGGEYDRLREQFEKYAATYNRELFKLVSAGN